MILRTAASDDFPTTLAACHGMRAYTRPIQCMDDEKTVKNSLQDDGETPIIAMTPFDEFRLSEAIGDQLMKSPCNSGSHAAADGPSSSVYSPQLDHGFFLLRRLSAHAGIVPAAATRHHVSQSSVFTVTAPPFRHFSRSVKCSCLATMKGRH